MTSTAAISANQNKIPPGTRRVEMASAYCVGCHLPHTVNADRLCEFCRRPAIGEKKTATGILSRFVGYFR